jgi:copper(I)-binding protein
MTGLMRRALLGAAMLTLPLVKQTACMAQATPIPPSNNAGSEAPVSVLILNSGTTPDRLIGATSVIAQEISLHATHLEQGERVMRQVSEIFIAADAMTSLEPGAMHVMLLGLRQGLVQGHVFPLTLQFADAGSVLVEVRVRRKQDAAGVPETPPVVAGSLTILHPSAPPAPAAHG